MVFDDDSSRGDLLDRARLSYADRAWTEAHGTFAAADKAAPLEPSDLALFATTAYMLGKVSEMLETQERAYHAYLERGEILPAARTAVAGDQPGKPGEDPPGQRMGGALRAAPTRRS